MGNPGLVKLLENEYEAHFGCKINLFGYFHVFAMRLWTGS